MYAEEAGQMRESIVSRRVLMKAGLGIGASVLKESDADVPAGQAAPLVVMGFVLTTKQPSKAPSEEWLVPVRRDHGESHHTQAAPTLCALVLFPAPQLLQ